MKANARHFAQFQKVMDLVKTIKAEDEHLVQLQNQTGLVEEAMTVEGKHRFQRCSRGKEESSDQQDPSAFGATPKCQSSEIQDRVSGRRGLQAWWEPRKNAHLEAGFQQDAGGPCRSYTGRTNDLDET
jgi:hypothetical protein